MRVLLTGGNGGIGSVATRYLLERGYDVRVIDLGAESKVDNVEYASCDIRDYDAVREQVKGFDAIVHMAAIPAPPGGRGPDIFHINVTGTYNIFEAAAREGITRIVQASSINAIGCAWNVNDFVPDYFPVDEGQTRRTDDPYSLSKQLVEDIGDYYWRRDGISSTGLRFPWVYPIDYYLSDAYYERRNTMKQYLETFIDLAGDEQQRLLGKVRDKVLAYRSMRPREFETMQEPPGDDELEDIDRMLWASYMNERFNLWTFVDVRDAAQSIEKSLTADFEGSHPLFINDTCNYVGIEAKTLANLFYPHVTEWKENLKGNHALFSIKRAQELIGFQPVYSVGNNGDGS